MLNPVNKSLNKHMIKMRNRKRHRKVPNTNSTSPLINQTFSGISIITCTNKLNYLSNIFENYNRQKFENKELIIVLNNDSIDKNIVLEISNTYPDVQVIQLSQSLSLGYCLNYAVKISKYDVIAKFDDDDYYGAFYLTEAIEPLYNKDIGLVGKGTTIVYFKGSKTLALRDPDSENCYVIFVNGSTLVFTKKTFEKVKFRNINIGEDVAFCNDCRKMNIKIYSTSRFNHVYIRYPSKKQHTWRIDDENFIREFCYIVGKDLDFIKYANNQLKV